MVRTPGVLLVQCLFVGFVTLFLSLGFVTLFLSLGFVSHFFWLHAWTPRGLGFFAGRPGVALRTSRV